MMTLGNRKWEMGNGSMRPFRHSDRSGGISRSVLDGVSWKTMSAPNERSLDRARDDGTIPHRRPLSRPRVGPHRRPFDHGSIPHPDSPDCGIGRPSTPLDRGIGPHPRPLSEVRPSIRLLEHEEGKLAFPFPICHFHFLFPFPIPSFPSRSLTGLDPTLGSSPARERIPSRDISRVK